MLLLVVLASVLDLAGPYLMGVAIDKYILKGDLPGLARLALLMFAVYMATALVVWLRVYVMAAVAQRTVRDLRNDLFAHFQTLSLRYIDQRSHGELMSRLTNDVENVSNVLNESVTNLISSVISIVGVAVVMFMINWRLALVSLVTLPLMAFLSQMVAKRTRRGFQQQQKMLGDINGMIEETITGQRVVKAYGREKTAIEQFEATNQGLRQRFHPGANLRRGDGADVQSSSTTSALPSWPGQAVGWRSSKWPPSAPSPPSSTTPGSSPSRST